MIGKLVSMANSEGTNLILKGGEQLLSILLNDLSEGAKKEDEEKK